MVPSFDLQTDGMRGALVGILSGALYAITTVLNRGYVSRIDALTLGLWQNAVGCVVLLPFRPELAIDPTSLGLVALLGIVFTGGAHALFIHGMREVPARLASDHRHAGAGLRRRGSGGAARRDPDVPDFAGEV